MTEENKVALVEAQFITEFNSMLNSYIEDLKFIGYSDSFIDGCLTFIDVVIKELVRKISDEGYHIVKNESEEQKHE